MVANVGQGFTALDAYRRVEVREQWVKQRIVLIPDDRYGGFSYETADCLLKCGSITGLLAMTSTFVAFPMALLSSRLIYKLPFVISLGAGLIGLAAMSARCCLDGIAKRRNIQKLQEELKTIHTLESQLSFEHNESVQLDLEKVDVLSYLADDDLGAFSLSQLYTVYNKKEQMLWNAGNLGTISQDKLLVFVKLKQLLELSEKDLVDALSDDGNSKLITQHSLLLQWLIQKLPAGHFADIEVQQQLQKSMPKKLPQDALQLVRGGATFEELKPKDAKKVVFLMGAKELQVTKERVVCESDYFKGLLQKRNSRHVLPDDAHAEFLHAIFDDIDGKEPLDITVDSWKRVFETAEKYRFSNILQSVESFCIQNLSLITEKMPIPVLAKFASERGQRFLLKEIEKSHLETLRTAAKTPEFLLKEFRFASTYGLSECREWLGSYVESEFEKWLDSKKPEDIVEQLNMHLSLWDIVSDDAAARLRQKTLDFLFVQVQKEDVTQKEKLLSRLWQMSCQRNNSILQHFIFEFCRDPSHSFYQKIAWPKLPAKIRAALQG